MKKKHLSSVIHQFKGKQIIVIGDVMIDRYLHGHVNRISPEAPVPIVHYQKEENRLGGAANVALNLQALDAVPHLISIVGQDDNASIFKSLLPQFNLSEIGIYQSNDRQTTVKTRVLAGSQQMMRVDREDIKDLNEKESNFIIQQVQKTIAENKINTIILQDYNKGVLTEQIIRQVTLIAQENDIPIVVDPKKKHFFSYKNCTLFKPNLKEVRESIPFEAKVNLDTLKKASDYLRSQLHHQITMITLSDKGIFVDNGKEYCIVPTTPRNIADVCGAGDTVVSVIALALALNCSIEKMAILGNLAGGQVCERVGVVPVNQRQLLVEYSKYVV